MAKQNQSKANKPSVSDTPTPTPKKRTKKVWLKTLYIKGHGMVAVGEEVKADALNAWAKHTKVKVDKFIGSEKKK